MDRGTRVLIKGYTEVEEMEEIIKKIIELMADVYNDLREYTTRILKPPYRSEVAENVIKLLENPGNTYIVYYDKQPVLEFWRSPDGRVGYTSIHATTMSGDLITNGGRVPAKIIVFFKTCKYMDKPELRLCVAHELTHAAGYHEPMAERMEEILTTWFKCRYHRVNHEKLCKVMTELYERGELVDYVMDFILGVVKNPLRFYNEIWLEAVKLAEVLTCRP